MIIRKTALLVGASGLIGSHCLEFLLADTSYREVRVLVRRPLDIEHPKLVQYQVNFESLGDYKDVIGADDVYCCLGTTIKKAGSKTAFARVDLGYTAEIAGLAFNNGATLFLLVSAMGADPGSRIFYNRIKGEVEESIARCGYDSVLIFRPSLLLGERKERRFGEELGQMLSRWLPFAFSGFMKKYRPIAGKVVAYVMVEIAGNQWQGEHIFESEKIESLYGQAQGLGRLM